MIRSVTIFLVVSILLSCKTMAAQEDGAQVRFASLNASLYRDEARQLKTELEERSPLNVRKIAAILQVNRPDVVLLNEFDFDPQGKAIAAFQDRFLAVSQFGNRPIRYEYVYSSSVNTGLDSGLDLDGDGIAAGTGNDAFGFGQHPGQYGMVVLSRFPIDQDNVRTFQKFLWKDMPECQWPIDPRTKKPFYSQKAKEIFRLSSKSHWDVPIQFDEKVVHFLVSHPTPPVFDQEEDRNGCRNHDEIRLWADYISPNKSHYLYDDQGVTGGLSEGADFVIAGDLNADPNDGDSRKSAARQLTEHNLINNSFVPASEGAVEATRLSRGANERQTGNPANDTGDFNDRSVGNLRIDYVLPSRTLSVLDSGVFWPKKSEANYSLVEATDHRLVWIDISLVD